MKSQTALEKQYSQAGGTLYLAFELGNREWRLAFTIGLGQKPRERTIAAGEFGKLKEEIERAKRRFGLPGSVRVVSCYEAGRDGFWLHRLEVPVMPPGLRSRLAGIPGIQSGQA